MSDNRHSVKQHGSVEKGPRTGAIGQRIYLAAEAIGLAARNLAAFQDDRFNKLLGLKSRGLAALHLTMLGHGD